MLRRIERCKVAHCGRDCPAGLGYRMLKQKPFSGEPIDSRGCFSKISQTARVGCLKGIERNEDNIASCIISGLNLLIFPRGPKETNTNR